MKTHYFEYCHYFSLETAIIFFSSGVGDRNQKKSRMTESERMMLLVWKWWCRTAHRKAGLSILVVHTGIAPAVPCWSTVVGGGATTEILVGSALWAVVWLVAVTYERDQIRISYKKTQQPKQLRSIHTKDDNRSKTTALTREPTLSEHFPSWFTIKSLPANKNLPKFKKNWAFRAINDVCAAHTYNTTLVWTLI